MGKGGGPEKADPETLAREIAQTRMELARTVDAIADRVSPKRIVQRGVQRVADGAGRFVDDVKANAEHFKNNLARDDEAADSTPPPNIAPVLIGIGALLVVGAGIAIVRRRRRRR